MANQQNALVDEFTKWDPMKEDYYNSEFNLYDDGPGAFLDPALQTSELAKEKTTTMQPYLVFKNLPKNMTEKSLKLLCERHCTVQRICENRKTSSSCAFVYFNNVADMDAVFRALKNANYGFHVSIGRNKTTQKATEDIDSELEKYWSTRFSLPTSDINTEDRYSINSTVVVSGKKPPRPQLSVTEQDFFKEPNENVCALSRHDPLQHCVRQTDSHELERAGINTSKEQPNPESEYQYRTGRVYHNMPEKTKSFVKAKHQNSIGTYNTDLEKYIKKIPLKAEPVIMHCVVCNAVADISCYRCGVQFHIYCGKECQNIDWENHRQICGKPKGSRSSSTSTSNASPNTTLKTNRNTTNKSLTSNSSTASSPADASAKREFPVPEMPPSNSTVTLTAVNSPKVVFIRSKENKENTKFFEIVTQLQAASKTLQPLKRLPAEGQAVIAKSARNSEYGRALVLKVQDTNNIRINYLDYGNVEIVKLDELYRIPDELMFLPRFAVPVILKNVPKLHMTNEIRSFMYSYLRDIDLIVKYSVESENLTAENVFQVDLFDAETNQHLNKTIATIGKPHEPINNDEILTIENLKYMPMPVGDDIELVILDNSQIHVGCISCSTKLYHSEIEGFQKDVQNYAVNLKPQNYAPRPDELCVAKYSVDNLWYRGRCIEKVGDGHPLILFIDYGNLDYVRVENIRPYPPEFNWGIFTADFGISGLPEAENLKEDLVKRLDELFPVGKTIQADNVEHFEGNYYLLKMNDIIKTLKGEKLLK